MEILYILFNIVFIIWCVFTITAYLNSDAKFSSEILDVYLNFIKLTVEKKIHTLKFLKTYFKVFQ